jgi:molybdopterin converting factor small subunit
MIVRVRLFARARELASRDFLDLEIPPGSTVADLRGRLAAHCPSLRSLLERSALGVDCEFASDSQVLQEGAEIALLPPVSGGSGVPGLRYPSKREYSNSMSWFT